MRKTAPSPVRNDRVSSFVPNSFHELRFDRLASIEEER